MRVFLLSALCLASFLCTPAMATEQDFSSPAAEQNFSQYGDMTKADSVSTLVASIQSKGSHDEVAYRSSGCSQGCSSGCSSGCSGGCSAGCSGGCSVGCSVGCRMR